MKRLFLSVIALSLAAFSTQAQIVNASFENWTGGEPDNWLTGNSGPFTFVTEINNAHAGNHALRSDVLNVGVPIASPILMGTNGYGVHTSTAPEAIHGWYILNSVNDDYMWGVAAITDNTGAGTGAGETDNLGATSVYKEFVLNMVYAFGVPTGDSLLLDFTISSAGSSVNMGSYFILDDLSFGAVSTGINDATSHAAGLEPICPNPSIDEAQIIYNIRTTGTTALNIYDMSGRLVQSLVNEVQAPGRYKAIADVAGLATGTYICKLSSGEVADVQKLIVQH